MLDCIASFGQMVHLIQPSLEVMEKCFWFWLSTTERIPICVQCFMVNEMWSRGSFIWLSDSVCQKCYYTTVRVTSYAYFTWANSGHPSSSMGSRLQIWPNTGPDPCQVGWPVPPRLKNGNLMPFPGLLSLGEPCTASPGLRPTLNRGNNPQLQV